MYVLGKYGYLGAGNRKVALHVQFAASDIGTYHLQETTWVIGVVEAHTFVVQLQVC